MTPAAMIDAAAHDRWMTLARKAALRSNCIRRSVGAAIVHGDAVAATGCNGVSETYSDCGEAGCPRCILGGATGSGYENCVCVHAEQAAIADAAARGAAVHGAALYVNLRPCLQCLAIARAAGIREVFFDESWLYPEEIERVYRNLSAHFDSFRRIETVGIAESLPFVASLLP